MSDPRIFTVKQCQPAYAANSGASIGAATSDRRNFYNSVGKIGDLQVLNSIGGGSIGKGLRTLAGISNSIRTGCGALPTSIGSTVEAGANWVMGHVGIAPSVVQAVSAFQPSIANLAYGQAKQIYQNVKQGKFKFSDIPNNLQNLQNLERLGRNIFTPSSGDAQSSLSSHCVASPYATDLIARAPKYKFLFIVQFIPSSGYTGLAGNDYGPLDMAFVVKKSSRPNIRYHEEDVNYYNFRSKVITKTEFTEMTMSFHDDTLDTAMQFYNAYTRAMTPITNIPTGSSVELQQNGMDFIGNTLTQTNIRDTIPTNSYPASHGPLADDNISVFSEIRLYHVFDGGNKMNVMRFMHPRINQLNLDELDMSVGGEGTELAITFSYDSVYIDPEVDMGSDQYDISETQRGAIYPLKFNDGATPEGPNNSGINPTGASVNVGDSCNPLKPMSTSGIGRAVSNAATAAIGNVASKFSSALSNLPFG